MNVQVGDTVVRVLGGEIKMPLKVTAITETRIVCGPWEFDKNTGGEIDEDLGWDGIHYTGSVLEKS